jgi:hypothetical protein
MLLNLLRGTAANEPEQPSGLARLLPNTSGPRMSLVQAMHALQRGEIERPMDSHLGGITESDELPLKRPPPTAPKPSPYQAELDAQRQQDKQDELDMVERARIRMKERKANVG